MFNLTHVRLLVPNFRDCFRFYRDVLGLEPTWGTEEDTYADFNCGPIALALFDQQEMAEAIGSALSAAASSVQDRAAFVLQVDKVDDTYQQLVEKGVVFVTKPQDRTGWGIRTAHFRDPAGNLLEIFEPLPRPQ